MLKDLNDLHKGLISYKNRQEKRDKIQLTEGQKKNLDALRSKLQFKYRPLKETISNYGGNTSVRILSMPWDIFIYSLRSLNMTPKQFDTLNEAINLLNKAIGKIESIPVASIDWRDISVAEPATVAEPKDVTESPVYLFDKMQFHPRVIDSSKSCFQSRLYREAILNAFISLIDYVKEITGSEDEGKTLMAHVFDEKKPLIKLNNLKRKTERDEQEGFKFIFMGATVGIRNPKAHTLIPQSDPSKTLEYLALASLLMRRVEEGELCLTHLKY